MVQRTIIRLAFPGGRPREKPGPYVADDAEQASANGTGRRAQPERGGSGTSGPEQSDPGVRVSVPD